MIIKTKYSTYEFEPKNNRFRKTAPEIAEWQPYIGLMSDPQVGQRLSILIDDTNTTKTSVVLDVQTSKEDDEEDEDEDEDDCDYVG